MSEDHKKDIDKATGVETTGHEWDGLKELNNPLPRWWVWVWIITIVWSIWYFVVYPAWPVPGGSTEGTGGYTQFKELAESQAEITQRQAQYLERFKDARLADIMNDDALYAFAIAGGKSAFKDNCATCHGTGGAGAVGYPNLNDDDWLWGGKLEDIHQTLLHGVRADNLDTRVSQMPAFGKDGLLQRAEIDAVVDYVLSLSGSNAQSSDHAHAAHGDVDHHDTKTSMHDMAATLALGQQVFQQQCVSCHGENGKGLHEFGAPNLTDAIWLYGGDRASVFETVYYARAGIMPAWEGRLDENTIKQLAIYVHELGGGEDAIDAADMITPVHAVQPGESSKEEEAIVAPNEEPVAEEQAAEKTRISPDETEEGAKKADDVDDAIEESAPEPKMDRPVKTGEDIQGL